MLNFPQMNNDSLRNNNRSFNEPLNELQLSKELLLVLSRNKLFLLGTTCSLKEQPLFLQGSIVFSRNNSLFNAPSEALVPSSNNEP